MARDWNSETWDTRYARLNCRHAAWMSCVRRVLTAEEQRQRDVALHPFNQGVCGLQFCGRIMVCFTRIHDVSIARLCKWNQLRIYFENLGCLKLLHWLRFGILANTGNSCSTNSGGHCGGFPVRASQHGIDLAHVAALRVCHKAWGVANVLWKHRCWIAEKLVSRELICKQLKFLLQSTERE